MKRSNSENLDFAQVEIEIRKIIKDSDLTEFENPFFIKAQDISKNKISVTANSALEITRHWRALSKSFMLTTLAGLAHTAYALELEEEPSISSLSALQTGIEVISDDLNNVHPIFKKYAPEGTSGIHYIWLEEEIMRPLALQLEIKDYLNKPLRNNTTALINGMRDLSQKNFGFSIQLRIVEAIALDVSLALTKILLNVKHAEHKVFRDAASLPWLIAHNKTEREHHEKVSHHENGVPYIITSEKEKAEYLQQTKIYTTLWKKCIR